jgi:NADH dehydrogenase FAD-containing subunit
MEKPKVVVLGSGFSAFSLLREIDTRLFNVTAVSPRNHLLSLLLVLCRSRKTTISAF